MPIEIYFLRTQAADVWVAWDGITTNSYAYGGCRMVDPRTRTEVAIGLVCSLMRNESGYKNTLINVALEAGAVDSLRSGLPPGFLQSRVGGGRCVIRPQSPAIAAVMRDPGHQEFRDVTMRIFEPLADLLNELNGRIKLTPDFGRYAGMADLLHERTPHVLGVSRELGGCGGKSTYSSTGVIAAYETLKALGAIDGRRETVLIGSAGAMGSNVLEHIAAGDAELAVCDLEYDGGRSVAPIGVRRLPSARGRFTDPCLEGAGCIVATTWGGELERSNHSLVPTGAAVLLAHNLALPSGQDGIDLTRTMSRRGVLVVPGQVLTIGGALTSRLEWFSRQAGVERFDKPLAHEVVRRVVGYWVERTARPDGGGSSPYEAMLQVCEGQAQGCL